MFEHVGDAVLALRLLERTRRDPKPQRHLVAVGGMAQDQEVHPVGQDPGA
jgi:hypothetical protein